MFLLDYLPPLDVQTSEPLRLAITLSSWKEVVLWGIAGSHSAFHDSGVLCKMSELSLSRWFRRLTENEEIRTVSLLHIHKENKYLG